MLHAAAMLCALIVLWMMNSQAWGSPQAWAVATGVSLLCVVVAARFGGASPAFARAPRIAWISLQRCAAVFSGALATIGRAVSADVTLKPALVRVKTRAGRPVERASFAHALTATPGMAVVETDSDGLLLHVMNEDRIDTVELGRLEQAVMSGGEGGQ